MIRRVTRQMPLPRPTRPAAGIQSAPAAVPPAGDDHGITRAFFPKAGNTP